MYFSGTSAHMCVCCVLLTYDEFPMRVRVYVRACVCSSGEDTADASCTILEAQCSTLHHVTDPTVWAVW